MRIGFDAKRLFNNFTGLGNHSRTTIDILTSSFPGNEYILYTPKTRDNPTTLPYLTKEGCKVVMPQGIVKGGLWRTMRLGKECDKDKIDIFHGLSNELPLALRCPSVVTIHDVAFHTFPDMYHWPDRMIYDAKWRYACRNADRIIAISECTKADIIKYYGTDESKIDVIYQPVQPRFYSPANYHPDTQQPFLLYVGSINSRKNLLGIVKAIELLPKSLQIPLVIVGRGREYKTLVQEYISSHHLEHLFIWPDDIGNDQLQELYQRATAFVYPSHYEGFGLPVVEALLSGCPVITSNVSSLPEAGGPFSLKATPTDTDDICDKIQQVLTSDSLRNSLSQQGREWAFNTFHPENLARQIMQVYNKTL